MDQKNIYSVGQVNTYIKEMFSRDILLSSVYVKGEVSNLKYHSSGHLYFSLKDETGTLSCVMFRGDRAGLSFPMKDGDKVVIYGAIEVYARAGSYQLYAKLIRLEGAGLLYERFLKLKSELEEMGMFDARYKLPVKKYNLRIGVVTSPTGAAVRDIQNISKRRNPYVQMILYPALVQGDGAAQSVVRGIRILEKAAVDVIIIGRGGGSLEDLFSFNEESVARAIFQCTVPVISAVGHETDTTISDYVADLRAPTPSAAAELAVFDLSEFEAKEDEFQMALTKALMKKISDRRTRLKQIGVRMNYLSPQRKVRDQLRRSSDLEDQIRDAMKEKIANTKDKSEKYENSLQNLAHDTLRKCRLRLEVLISRYQGLNPLDKLRQGFAYVENNKKRAVRSITAVRIGDPLRVHVTDGTITADVTGTLNRTGDKNE